LIELNDIVKIYKIGSVEIPALCGVTLNIKRGEFISIMGASGSGKSTLLNILGCLDTPTSGIYKFEDIEVNGLTDEQLAIIRNKRIGFVFQNYNLLARTNALENVELPLLYANKSAKERIKLAREALNNVGLGDRIYHQPNELSGGEQQRVAIARALVNKPDIILADEPTGNLDSKAGEELMSLFQKLNQQGITIIVVTHDAKVAQYGKRIIRFRDGRIIGEEIVNNNR